MTETFRALRLHKTDAAPDARFEDLGLDDLMAGDVTVRVEHSTINFKDGLAITGRSPIARTWPLIPGIDFAGVVETSESDEFKPGDRVVLNGWGVGEGHHGGYAGKARVKADWLVKLPEGLTSAQAMAIGTAGYTSMLCVLGLERQGIGPDRGDILVTGAAGGVGLQPVTEVHDVSGLLLADDGDEPREGVPAGERSVEARERDNLAQRYTIRFPSRLRVYRPLSGGVGPGGVVSSRLTHAANATAMSTRNPSPIRVTASNLLPLCHAVRRRRT